MKIANIWSKVTIGAGAAALVIPQVLTIPGLSPQTQQVLGAIGGIAAILGGLAHPTPQAMQTNEAPKPE